MTVGSALLGQRGRLRRGHVLQPFGRFPRSPRTHIDGDVRVSTDLIDEIHELVRAESVGLDHAAPVGVQRYGSLSTDAVPPMVFVGKATARPADVGNLDRLKSSHNVIANAACVRDRGIRANPDSVVNPMAEMLGELSENVAVDLRRCPGHVNRQFDLLRRRRRKERHCQNKNERRDPTEKCDSPTKTR
jgi:hypothetical protein